MTIHHLLLVELLLEVLDRGVRGRVEELDGDVVLLLAGDADDHGDALSGLAGGNVHGEHDAIGHLGFTREGAFLAVGDLVVIARHVDVGAVGRQAVDVLADGEAAGSAVGVSEQAGVVDVVVLRRLVVDDGRDADEDRLGTGAEVADAGVRGERGVEVRLVLVALAALEVHVGHELLRVLDGQQALGQVRVGVQLLRGRSRGRRNASRLVCVATGAGAAGGHSQNSGDTQCDKRGGETSTTNGHGRSHSS